MLPAEWMMQEKRCRCLLEDYDEALNYAEMLHSDNTDRKEADSNITDEAFAMIKQMMIGSKENQPLFLNRTGIKVLWVLSHQD